MSQPGRVIVGASCNMDVVCALPAVPVPGAQGPGDAYTLVPGGKGLNQAVAARRMGAPVALAGCVGDDAWGAQVRAFLEAEDIDTTALRSARGERTALALVLVEPGGRNTIIVVPGANARFGVEDAAARSPGRDDLVLATLESPLATVTALFAGARAAGARTLLNAAPAMSVPGALLRMATLLVVNELELAALTGEPPSADPGAAAAALARLRRPGQTVIATLGEQGCVVVTDDISTHIGAPPVEAVDTSAAGDCFTGTLAARLLAGDDVASACARGVEAASLSVQRRGTSASMPRLEEMAAAAAGRPTA